MSQYSPESQEEADYYQGHEEPEPEPETVGCFKCGKEMYQVSDKPEENICIECTPQR